MGAPVVSTPIPELEPLAPLVRLASGADGFIRCIEEAARESDSEDLIGARIALARGNSWEGVFERIDQGLSEIGLDLRG